MEQVLVVRVVRGDQRSEQRDEDDDDQHHQRAHGNPIAPDPPDDELPQPVVGYVDRALPGQAGHTGHNGVCRGGHDTLLTRGLTSCWRRSVRRPVAITISAPNIVIPSTRKTSRDEAPLTSAVPRPGMLKMR